MCGGAAMVATFQQAARRVLGAESKIDTEVAASDPSDDEAVSKSTGRDGVVELSFSPEGQKARLHCYLAREKRWLDREISFGASRGSLRSEISERGRLLGFAVATMYARDTTETEHEQAVAVAPAVVAPLPQRAPELPVPPPDRRAPAKTERGMKRMAEFAAIASSGLRGTASGLGASAGFRYRLVGPVWGRLFVAGRSGNIPEAQASTRTALMGGGMAVALLPESSTWELGARLDAFAGYFDVSHLSEDDIEPDRRSRWQAGGDLMAEGGWRVTSSAGVFLDVGIEAVVGETAIYTHHNRVAVVPPFRATAELGFRTRF